MQNAKCRDRHCAFCILHYTYHLYGSILASFGASAASTTVVPRSPRFRLVDLLLRRCCLNAFPRRNFPFFVRLKRLAAPRCVFSFGIVSSNYLAVVAAAGFALPPPVCGRRVRMVCI